MRFSVGGSDVGHSLLAVGGVLWVTHGLKEALAYVCVEGGVVCLFHCALS